MVAAALAALGGCTHDAAPAMLIGMAECSP